MLLIVLKCIVYTKALIIHYKNFKILYFSSLLLNKICWKDLSNIVFYNVLNNVLEARLYFKAIIFVQLEKLSPKERFHAKANSVVSS